MPRRGENIYKRKDGRWEGRYIKEYDLNNKAKYGSVYAHSYIEVKNKLSLIKQYPSNNTPNADIYNKTFGEYASQWLSYIEKQIKHSTYVKYTNTIKNHIIPFIGNQTLGDITTERIKDFIDEKLSSGNIKTKEGLSTKTVKDMVSIIHLVIKYCNELGIESNCKFENIVIKTRKKSIENISKDEHIRLVHYLLNDIDNSKLGVLICLFTGLRIGEICAMKFEDISLCDKLINVNKTMQRVQTLSEMSNKKTEVIITSPKSDSSCRIIPLPDFIVDIIEQFYNNPKNFILTGTADKYIEPRTMENRFKKYLKECNIKKYTFHQLRHSFATHCMEIGFDIKSLSEILGHSSVNITLNRYVHSSFELKRVNMNKLEVKFAY